MDLEVTLDGSRAVREARKDGTTRAVADRGPDGGQRAVPGAG